MITPGTFGSLWLFVLFAGKPWLMMEETRPIEFAVYRELGANWRPGDPIRELVCTEDKVIASTIGGNTELDEALTVFDRRTGDILFPRLMHGSGMPRRMSTGGVGRPLVSGANDGVVRFWSLTRLRQQAEAEIHFDDAVESVAMTADQRFGCILVDRNTIDGWDFARSRRRYRISHLRGRVSDITCHFERDLLVAVMPPNRIELFVASSGKHLVTHRFANVLAYTCCIAPDSGRLLLVGADPSEKSILFEVNLRERGWHVLELSRLDCHTCAVFSPSGGLLASGGADPRQIILLDTTNWQQLATLTGHTDRVRSIAFAPQGGCIYSGGNDGIVRCWHVSATTRNQLDIGPQHRVTCVRFSPSESERLAVATGDGTVSFWQVQNDVTVQHREAIGALIHVFAWAPDGGDWAAGTRECTHARIANVRRVFNEGATAISFRGASRRRISVNDGRTVRLWNLDQEVDGEIAIPARSEERLSSIISLPTQESICVVGTDLGRVFAIDVNEKSVVKYVTLRDSTVTQLVSSTDGSLVYCASRDGFITVLDASTLEAKRCISAHSSWINDLAISSDGRLLASASHDGTVAVWHSSSMSQEARLTGHSGVVRSVSFSPNGKFLASGGDDARVIIWSMGKSRTP